MPRSFCLLLCLFITGHATAQSQGLYKQLDAFWSSKNSRAKHLAEAIHLQPGDTVADIGTANGWFLAALSTYADSITFYLEDIDSSSWNRAAFDSAYRHFSMKGEKSRVHRFHYVKGSETSTRLPERTFHKVLIIDTYHHFSDRDAMLNDITSLLRPGGKVVIVEALARRPGDVHRGCRKNIFSEQEIISHMESGGMELEERRTIHKAAGRDNKVFIFTLR